MFFICTEQHINHFHFAYMYLPAAERRPPLVLARIYRSLYSMQQFSVLIIQQFHSYKLIIPLPNESRRLQQYTIFPAITNTPFAVRTALKRYRRERRLRSSPEPVLSRIRGTLTERSPTTECPIRPIVYTLIRVV